MTDRFPRTHLSRYPARDQLLVNYVPIRQRLRRVHFPVHPAARLIVILFGMVLLFVCSIPCLAVARLMLR